VFIGTSFIVKKKGLRAGASGVRAGVTGTLILYEPLWWAGMITMIVGEVANFAAYAFAPAILELKLSLLQKCRILLQNQHFYFMQRSCLLELFVLIFRYIPQYGQTHIMVYIGVCSLLIYPQTWLSVIVVACILTQMNYLNKALDTFNTAVVSPIYYTMFTSLTILASVIMFKDWDHKTHTNCDRDVVLSPSFPGHFFFTRLKIWLMASHRLCLSGFKHGDENGYASEGIPLRSAAEGLPLRSPRAAE
ncbi:hypothetical protein ZWY2020_025341, partial [Hordeum vulgare]